VAVRLELRHRTQRCIAEYDVRGHTLLIREPLAQCAQPLEQLDIDE
jgi:hypothetical protein